MTTHIDLSQPAVRKRAGRLLGDIIVDLGFCDRATVESAVHDAAATGVPIGNALLKREALTDDQLAIALATRFDLPFVELDAVDLDPAALSLVPEAAARRMDAVPIQFDENGGLVVAMVNPRNLLAIDDLAMLTERTIVPVVVTRRGLDGLMSEIRRRGEVIDEQPEAEDEEDADARDIAHEATQDDGPAVKLVRSIIAQAISEGASDIHFDPDDGDLLVRYRIDGMMRDITRVPRRQAGRIISRIKILSDLDISERRVAQDGRTSLVIDGRRIDIRVATVPLVSGEAAVLRVLDPGERPLSLGELGMSDESRRLIETALMRAHGAILATGPTGSGKSTTLYAAVGVINTPEKTLMTIEDPVEYRLARVKQMQVFERAGVTFSSGLRTIVRSDPDVIMVGEMRDRDSAKIAIEAALTGHLLLSSLHTNSAPAAAARLVDMGIEPYLVASSLECVIGQRLARTLCERCKTAVTVAGADVGVPDVAEVGVFEPAGCRRCGQSGYRGRLGLYEVMTVTEEIRTLIVARATASEIGRMAVSQGMCTLREDGLGKVRAGKTSLAEVVRVTS